MSSNNDIILMAHGGGGIRTKKIIDEIIVKHLGNPILAKMDDAACIDVGSSEIVFTTDSFVVSPIFFPGGDIGTLAACGTINDLAMQGAEPKYLSLALILEEGLKISDLEKVIESLAKVLKETNVSIVTGDTKVVERGSGTGISINTSGIGKLLPGVDVHVSNAKPGDAIIVTGPIGDHGITIMSCREGLNFETELSTDAAPLSGLSKALLDEIPSIHCLRDPTRGGVAAAVCDIAEQSNVGIELEETSLPIRKEVSGACQLLGLDPLNVANEGKALIVCDPADTEKALEILQSLPLGKESKVIGTVTSGHTGMVLLKTRMGGERIVEIPSGEDLPRIC